MQRNRIAEAEEGGWEGGCREIQVDQGPSRLTIQQGRQWPLYSRRKDTLELELEAMCRVRTPPPPGDSAKEKKLQ